MIDTHQHLFEPNLFSYSWTKDLPTLQGRFALVEYRNAAASLPIEGTIFMEGDVDPGQSAGEAAFFCKLAEDPDNRVLGVVAAARPEYPGFEESLDQITHPKLKGIRRVLHTQPDELSQSSLFRKNIAMLAGRNLTFDLCFLERQLPIAIALIDACPNTQFVLDHCGVPDIAANSPEFWHGQISDLAKRPNVACKISGLTVYASNDQRNHDVLKPYVATVLEVFGVKRCVWGGDWPVVNLGSGLPGWCKLSLDLLSELSTGERDGLLSINAKHIYNL